MILMLSINPFFLYLLIILKYSFLSLNFLLIINISILSNPKPISSISSQSLWWMIIASREAFIFKASIALVFSIPLFILNPFIIISSFLYSPTVSPLFKYDLKGFFSLSRVGISFSKYPIVTICFF